MTKAREVKHRRFIASLPCIVTMRSDVQCAHIRKKGNAGMGLKSSDSRTVPLSVETHATQGQIGEELFWRRLGGIDSAISLAEALYANTGDRQKCLELISYWRQYAISFD